MTHDEIFALVQELTYKINSLHASFSLKMPDIRYHNTAGLAGQVLFVSMQNSWVSFNPTHMRNNPDFHLTVRHEMAHGPEFRKCCLHLGGTGATRSSYAMYKIAPDKYFPYTCACPGKVHSISKMRHARALNGTMDYICKYCKKSIKEAK